LKGKDILREDAKFAKKKGDLLWDLRKTISRRGAEVAEKTGKFCFSANLSPLREILFAD
jgi:hypothetical protein